MAEIRPFRGLRYDLEQVGGLDAVIGPAEDIPTIEAAAALVSGKPFHSVRLEMRERSDLHDFSPSRVYLERWLRSGILVSDPTHSFYVHEHEYTFGGKLRRLRGFFAALRLSGYEERQVLPHENTSRFNVCLRYALLRDVRANLSAIYTLAREWDAIAPVLDRAVDREPVAFGSDGESGVHRIWPVTDSSEIEALRRAIDAQPLYIADGHHRYEAALAYQRRQQSQPMASGAADWVLAYIADAADPGILVLPMHRLIRSLGQHDCRETTAYLSQLFDINVIPLPCEGGEDLVIDAVDRLAKQSDSPSYLILEPGCQHLLAVQLRDWEPALRLLPDDAGPVTNRLDVAVLDAVLLHHFLGLSPQEIEAQVEFTPDTPALFRRVRSGDAAMAVFVRPTPLDSLMEVARTSGRMPQKSTYFYPKIPIGLVMRDLDTDPDPPDIVQRAKG